MGFLPNTVKIIMDKISKRSKGYAFIEYATEAAAGTALKEMNGKVIHNAPLLSSLSPCGDLLSSDWLGFLIVR